jgi:hypothetical protein
VWRNSCEIRLPGPNRKAITWLRFFWIFSLHTPGFTVHRSDCWRLRINCRKRYAKCKRSFFALGPGNTLQLKKPLLCVLKQRIVDSSRGYCIAVARIVHCGSQWEQCIVVASKKFQIKNRLVLNYYCCLARSLKARFVAAPIMKQHQTHLILRRLPAETKEISE